MVRVGSSCWRCKVQRHCGYIKERGLLRAGRDYREALHHPANGLRGRRDHVYGDIADRPHQLWLGEQETRTVPIGYRGQHYREPGGCYLGRRFCNLFVHAQH